MTVPVRESCVCSCFEGSRREPGRVKTTKSILKITIFHLIAYTSRENFLVAICSRYKFVSAGKHETKSARWREIQTLFVGTHDENLILLAFFSKMR